MATWSVPFTAFIDRIKAKVDAVPKRALFRLFTTVVTASPVDTGRFRANWNVGWGKVDYGTSSSVSLVKTAKQLSDIKTHPFTGVVYLTNNLPYARKLEHGYSAQAPRGMVAVSIALWPAIIRASVKE